MGQPGGFCPQCGAKLGEGYQFCGQCGFATAADSPPLPPPPGHQDPRIPSRVPWVVLSLILIAGGVAVALILTRGGERTTPSAASATTEQAGSTSSSGSTLATATTASPTTTTISPSTTTTLLPPPGEFQPYLSEVPPSLPRSEGASGSGCMAGSGPLWDGMWFGYVEGQTPDAVVFNLACFYYGDRATSEATVDHITLRDNYYIRNQVSLTWDLAFHPEAVAYILDPAAPGGFTAIPHEQWPASSGLSWACPGALCGVWLYINGSLVTALVEFSG